MHIVSHYNTHRKNFKRQVNVFDVPALTEEFNELQEEMSAEGFWDDMARAQKVSKRSKSIEDKMAEYSNLQKQGKDVETWINLAQEEDEASLISEIGDELKTFTQLVQQLHLKTLLNGQYDSNNAILSLHAGAGGTEAQDWCEMLYRLYTRYAEKKRFDTKILDILDGDEAGIKSVTFEVIGENAYGYLKAEKGVHRLVRISPFDSNARRHTSFVSLDVMPEIDDDVDVQINSDDLRVDTYRSSGAGGQHVNKTESAIRITHIPTGVVVSCQTERSQIQNRETAMRMLRSRLVEIKERENMEKIIEIKGDLKKIEWGSQIRSYVFHPYSMVKDHRTGEETGNVQAVMDGEVDAFIHAYLTKM